MTSSSHGSTKSQAHETIFPEYYHIEGRESIPKCTIEEIAYIQDIVEKIGAVSTDEFVTIKNLEIVKIDKEKSLVLIKGAIPGKKDNLVEITS